MLVTPVLQVVHRVITRHRPEQTGLKADQADSGAVTPIQRFGSAVNLNIHLHCLVLDGVYRRADGEPVFVELPAPTDEEWQTLLRKIITRRMKQLTRRGVLVEEEEGGSRCDADERQRLEQQGQTITRPALANERVQINSAGQVVLTLKTAWRDGITHIVMSPLEFMQRLAAQVTEGRLSDIRAATAAAPDSVPCDAGAQCQIAGTGGAARPRAGYWQIGTHRD